MKNSRMNYKIIIPLILSIVLVSGCTTTTSTPTGYAADKMEDMNDSMNATMTNPGSQVSGTVKEIYMDSFVVFEDGTPKPQFSVKEITANKGDTVKIHVNVTRGTHDFNIDEFNVHSATPTNQTAIVGFTADKAGEFVYYCNMPGHRQAGHWGTLKVLDNS